MKEFTLTVENYMVVPVDKVKKGKFTPVPSSPLSPSVYPDS